MTEMPQLPLAVGLEGPSPARIYDYMLGGCHSRPADQEAAAKFKDAVPEFHEIAWANRGFHQRAARWIAGQEVRQFLDLGSGFPTVGNTHEVVREAEPTARVVYVDMDPAVAASGHALDGDDGATLIQADLRDPDALLAEPELARLIDFTEPVGLIMTGVLHFVAAGSDPWGLVRRYVHSLAPGSYLALSHATADGMPPLAVERWEEVYTNAPVQLHLRDRASVRHFFTGLELQAPYQDAPAEVTYLGLWGCEDPGLADSDGSRWGYCGVGRRW